jgi:hypothetical protein
MLEQAIVDAAALREAALKNAEQAIIEKYAPQIKEAVDSMLETEVNENRWVQNQLVQHEGKFARITTETDQGKVGIQYIGEDKTSLVLESDLERADEALLQEEEGMAMGGGTAEAAPTPSATSNIPYAAGVNPDGEVNARMNVYDFSPDDFDVDLEDLFLSQDDAEVTEQPPASDDIDLDLDLSSPEATDEPAEEPVTGEPVAEPEAADDEELLFEELLDAIKEELEVDMGEAKTGHFTTDEGTLKYEQEKALAKAEDDKKKEEDEEYNKKIEELDETVRKQTAQIKDLLTIVEELNGSLNETLLSNAKLLYCNKTLSDASLNERQKNKIVEAIASANTPDEAKTLQETLKATVGTTKKKGPQSLSESVNRKSNLSGIMPRRKQSAQQFTFAEHMKKLAGIK